MYLYTLGVWFARVALPFWQCHKAQSMRYRGAAAHPTVCCCISSAIGIAAMGRRCAALRTTVVTCHMSLLSTRCQHDVNTQPRPPSIRHRVLLFCAARSGTSILMWSRCSLASGRGASASHSRRQEKATGRKGRVAWGGWGPAGEFATRALVCACIPAWCVRGGGVGEPASQRAPTRGAATGVACQALTAGVCVCVCVRAGLRARARV